MILQQLVYILSCKQVVVKPKVVAKNRKIPRIYVLFTYFCFRSVSML